MNIIENYNRIKTNRFFITMVKIISILLFISIIAFIMLRYHIVGEDDKNWPFNLANIMVVSTAEGSIIENTDITGKYNLMQNNDIYITINKNENYKKNETIKNISFENIEINKKESIGEIVNYKPATEGLFKNSEEYRIKDKLNYTGGSKKDISEQKINSQSETVTVSFRSANMNLKTYETSDVEVVHNGLLLAKAGIEESQLKYSIEFDLIIETKKGIKYKAEIKLDLPEENLLVDGRSSMEKTNFDDVIFKRI